MLRLLYANQPYYNYFLGIVAGAVILYVLVLCRLGSFGGEDTKLLAVIGAVMGWQGSLIFLLFMLGIAGVFEVMLWRNR